MVDTDRLTRLHELDARPPVNTKPRLGVLVVEDEKTFLKYVVNELRTLSSDGKLREVYGAETADEAIQLLEDHPDIGCLLTDLRLRGVHQGDWLIDQVKTRWPNVEIASMSCHHLDFQRLKGRCSLAFDKPIDDIHRLCKQVHYLSMSAA